MERTKEAIERSIEVWEDALNSPDKSDPAWEYFQQTAPEMLIRLKKQLEEKDGNNGYMG